MTWFLFSEIFLNMEDIKRECNPIVDLLKFTFDKNILSETIYIYIYILCKIEILLYLNLSV